MRGLRGAQGVGGCAEAVSVLREVGNYYLYHRASGGGQTYPAGKEEEQGQLGISLEQQPPQNSLGKTTGQWRGLSPVPKGNGGMGGLPPQQKSEVALRVPGGESSQKQAAGHGEG